MGIPVPNDPPELGVDPEPGVLPPVDKASERVAEFLRWYGDGRIVPDVPREDPAIQAVGPPLYSRDLEALRRAAPPPLDATAGYHDGVVFGIRHPGPHQLGCPYCIDTLWLPGVVAR